MFKNICIHLVKKLYTFKKKDLLKNFELYKQIIIFSNDNNMVDVLSILSVD